MNELREAEAKLEATGNALKDAIHEAGKEPDGGGDTKPAPKKSIGTNRGIETMLRSAYRVQMDLTGLADNKANMMISINGIIISIIIASVAPKLDANPWLLIPTAVFLIGNLVSIV